jgi:histidinol phosphatase-like enzyme (inositol monophosphatase family)
VAPVLPWDEPTGDRVEVTGDDVVDFVAVAHTMADAAREVTLGHFRTADLAPEHKAKAGDPEHDLSGQGEPGFDPVTAADRGAERAMRTVLAARRADDGIVGEELEVDRGTSGLTWVLDPIDGTRAFVAGMPTWGILIALFDGVEPVIGVVDHPVTDERWVGIATPNHRSCRRQHAGATTEVATRSRPLDEAVLATTFPEVGTDEERAAFERVRDRVRLTRYGADSYAYALVAAGTVDVVVEAGLAPWDVQALVPIVRGAGGTMTAWDGRPAHAGGRVVAAGSATLHARTMELLADGTG